MVILHLLLPGKEPDWFHLKTLRRVRQHSKSSLYYLHVKQFTIKSMYTLLLFSVFQSLWPSTFIFDNIVNHPRNTPDHVILRLYSVWALNCSYVIMTFCNKYVLVFALKFIMFVKDDQIYCLTRSFVSIPESNYYVSWNMVSVMYVICCKL